MTTPVQGDLASVETTGRVDTRSVRYAQQKVAAVLHFARDPILFARIRLTELADPSLERPSVAQVNLDVNGRVVRVQVARPTMVEAIDEAADRLRQRLNRTAGDWQAIRGSRPLTGTGEWRHESAPSDRPPFFPRPPEERRVVRRKAFAVPRMTVDEAAFDMDTLDYAFHLFTELGSDVDSVLHLVPDEPGYRLNQVRPHPDLVTLGRTAVTISPHPAPVLSVDEAVERLNLTGWPFVLFVDPAVVRGCVLYHRYDGHYGLLLPAE